MNFVVQTVNGQCKLDLCQAMQNAIEYDAWKTDKSIGDVIYCDFEDIEKYADINYCPVGTLEFFFKYVDCLFGSHSVIKPLNVPDWMYDFTEHVYNVDDLSEMPDIEITEQHPMFMKSRDIFKSDINGFISSIDEIKENVQLTNAEDIVSEYRIFVHNGEFIDIRNYSGDPFIFPNPNTIARMELHTPMKFEGTVDIMVTANDETKILECHEFFSCGLYGFSNYNVLPSMLWRTWIRNCNKLK